MSKIKFNLLFLETLLYLPISFPVLNIWDLHQETYSPRKITIPELCVFKANCRNGSNKKQSREQFYWMFLVNLNLFDATRIGTIGLLFCSFIPYIIIVLVEGNNESMMSLAFKSTNNW